SSKERVEPERQANERHSEQNRVPKRQPPTERRRPAQHAANLVASTRAQPRGARRRLEHEAHPAHRLEQRRLALILVDLASQTTRVHVDDVRVRVLWVVPYMLEQFGASHDTSGVSREIDEQREFLGGEVDSTLAVSTVRSPTVSVSGTPSRRRLPRARRRASSSPKSNGLVR